MHHRAETAVGAVPLPGVPSCCRGSDPIRRVQGADLDAQEDLWMRRLGMALAASALLAAIMIAPAGASSPPYTVIAGVFTIHAA
jgi:hypothetical protein